MPKVLRFGIESLDKLIGGSKETGFGINLARHKAPGLATSLCLIGPDGAGKSVLALHLAAQYLADCNEVDGSLPKVLSKNPSIASYSFAISRASKFSGKHGSLV